MKINSFKAFGVHNYLDFDINFFPDVTFLIGINGSGKTSALKLILGLTSPRYNYLNQINYEYCEIVCSTGEDEKDIIIKSEQNANENTLNLSLEYRGETITSEPIKRFSRSEDQGLDAEDISLMERKCKEAFDSMDVAEKIRELATPKFLGLDRRIYQGSWNVRPQARRQWILSRGRSKSFEGLPEPQAIDVSLDEVQSLVFDYTRKLPRSQNEINEKFKEQLFSQSLHFVQDYNLEDIPSLKEIGERKIKVLSAIESLGFNYLKSTVESFFGHLERIAKENEEISESEKMSDETNFSQKYLKMMREWYINGDQLKKIDDIIMYSQGYQEAVAKLRAPFEKL